jgi:hypothetical protein
MKYFNYKQTNKQIVQKNTTWQLFKKIGLLSAAILFLSLQTALAGSGIFESYAIVNSTFYDLQNATANPDFAAANLGNFTMGTGFNLGSQIKTFKNGSDNICEGRIYYSIYPASGSVGSFTQINLPFLANLVSPGDQSWQLNPGSAVGSALPPGNYKIAVKVGDNGDGAGGCTSDPFHTMDNSGAYWIANFTVSGATPVTITGNAAGSYATIAAAITALNGVGTMTSTTNVYVNIGYAETAPVTGFALTATGTATAPLIFNGNTATINAGVGTATPSSSVLDGMFSIRGGDYITIQDFTFTDANTANPATMEYGVAMFKASTTDGAQNNTIKNNVFNMQRINFANGTAPTVEGSVAIYMLNSIASAATTVLTITAASGANANNKIMGNTTSGGNYGIVCVGFSSTTPFATADVNNQIGGSLLTDGNTILNFGGGTASTNPSAGIRYSNQYSILVQNNNIDNNNGSGVNHPNTLRGIFSQLGTSNNISILNNIISIKGGGTSNVITGIENTAGILATVNINNNIIQNCTYTTATTGTLLGIVNSAAATTLNVNNNRILGYTLPGTTSTSNGIQIGSPITAVVSNNYIGGVTRTSSGAGTQRGINMTSPTTVTFNADTIENITFNNATSTGGIEGIYGFSSSAAVTITNCVIRNLSIPNAGVINGIREFGSIGTKIYSNNTINNFSTSAGGSGGAVFNGISVSIGTITANGNLIHSLISTGLSGTVTGILLSGALSASVNKNKIYNLSSSNTAGSVSGITVGNNTTTTTLANNYVGDLFTPASTSGNSVIGLNIASGTTVNAFYNTINIGGTSTGVGFGSSAVSASTFPTVNLRNNIFVNNCTPTGTSLAAAYRRSSNSIGTYDVVSNRNLFFGSTIYTDNTVPNTFTTLAAYKTFMATRDQNAVSENPTYVSTTGSAATYLHINPTVPTAIEGNAGTIAAITDDYDSDTRNATTPDIGADEGMFTPLPQCAGTPAASTITGVAAVCTGFGTTLGLSTIYTDVGITYQWKSSTTSGGPYTNLGTATGQATGALTATTYYVCTITCSNSSQFINTPEKTISVNPLPIVALSASATQYCAPGTAVVLTASNAATYTWLPATGLSASTGAIVNASPAANTTYTVSGTDVNGCVGTTNILINAGSYATIISSNATPAAVCAGGTSTLNVVAPLPSAPAVYNFTASTSTFNSISAAIGVVNIPAANFSSQDDASIGNLPIGFTLNYNNSPQSIFAVSTNGLIILGQATNSTGLSSNSLVGNANIIAPYWDDNNLTGGSIDYLTVGSIPNRVTTIQWNNLHIAGSGNASNPTFTMQAKLYEGTNNIEFVYAVPSATFTATASIGISGAVGNFKSITPLLPVTTSTSSSISENSSVSGATNLPSGTSYLFALPSATLSWQPSVSLSSSNTIASPITIPLSTTTVYTVTSTNGACATTSSVTVSAGVPLSAALTITGATACSGVKSIVASPTGGGAPYTYAWKQNGASIANTTASFNTAIGNANYEVTITDACGISASATLNGVFTAETPVASATTSGLICLGNSLQLNGATTVGSAFAWAGPNTYNANIQNPIIASLPAAAAGIYTLSVSNAGCVGTSIVNVSILTGPLVTKATASSATICDGSSVDLSSSASNALANYVASSIPPSSETPSGLAYVLVDAGVVSAVSLPAITARVGNSLDDGYWDNIPLPFAFNFYGINYSSIRIGTNGNVQFGSVISTGGNPGASSWTPQTIPTAGGNLDNFIGGPWMDQDVSAGTGGKIQYFTNGVAPNRKFVISFEVCKVYQSTDQNTSQIILNENGSVDINLLGDGLIATTSKAIGMENVGGTLGAFASGRNAGSWTTIANETWHFERASTGISFAWAGPASYTASTQNVTGILPSATAAYTVTATAINGCTASATTSITVNPLPTPIYTINPVSCFGGTNGSFTLGAVGTYLVDGATYTGATFGASTHTISVTDANGCVGAITNAMITEPAILTASASVTTPILCNGGNAIINVSASGGNGSYSTIGTYTVASGAQNYTITDAKGCTAIANITVPQPAPLTLSLSTIPALLCNGDLATYTATASGGTPYSGPFPYGFTNGSSASFGNNAQYTAGGGSYTISIADANNCTSQQIISITAAPSAIVLSTVANQILCATNLSGSGLTGGISWSGSGGTSPLSYTVNGTAATSPVSNLIANTYTLVATDGNGCTKESFITIAPAPAPLTATLSAVPITCFGGTTTIITTPSGGTTPYTYGSAGTITSGVFANQAVGLKNVIINDFNGCKIGKQITLTQPTEIIVTSAVTTPIACNGNTGIVTIFATGGTLPYTFGAGSPFNTYSVCCGNQGTNTVVDANGCVVTNTIAVYNPPVLTASIAQGAVIACKNGTSTYTVSAAGGTAPYQIGASPTFNPNSIYTVMAGTYSHNVMDANGCIATTNVIAFSNPPMLDVNITANTNPILINNTLILSATSTYATSFTWAGPGSAGTLSTVGAVADDTYTKNMISVLEYGQYTVTVVNATGCVTNSIINIEQNRDVNVRIKVLLSGPLQSNGKMTTALTSVLPNSTPYQSAPYIGFYPLMPLANLGGETMVPGVLSQVGDDAIVDWVYLQLRSKTDANIVVSTRSALLKSNGFVVDMDGSSDVLFSNVGADDYFVTVLHRNHLGIMGAAPYNLSNTTVSTIDFTNISTPLYNRLAPNNNPTLGAMNATRNVGGKRALFAGNANISNAAVNKYITYNSTIQSDRSALFLYTGATGTIPGYSVYDVNMDGFARFNGLNPDRLFILLNCNNSNTLIINQQTPN